MSDRRFTRIAAFVLVIALLAGITAGIGAFNRGDGSLEQATSIRGEAYEYATTGVYAFNAERVVAEGVGWDWVTLFLAVPVLIATIPGIARGSLRARLLATGLLGYLFYQYLMYAVFWAFGPLYVPFVVLYAASAVAIVMLVSTIDVRGLPSRFSGSFPRRTTAVVTSVMALQLVAMWGQRIATAYRGDFAGAGFEGTPTLTVQALDLGILVPLSFAAAYLVWTRRPWGYLLASVFAVKAVTMASAICAMLISAALVEGMLEVPPFLIFATATGLFGFVAYRAFASITPEHGAGRAASDVAMVGT